MSDLVNLIVSVLLGGLLALAGVFLGPWLQERSQDKQRRAQKFEDFVAALYEHKHWLTTLRNISAYGEAGTIGVSPFAKVQAIAIVYFPELMAIVKELDTAASYHELGIYQAGAKRLDGDIVGMGEDVRESVTQYIQTFQRLMYEIGQYGQREFGVGGASATSISHDGVRQQSHAK